MMHKKIFLLSFAAILVLTAGLAQAVSPNPVDLGDSGDGTETECPPKPVIESIVPLTATVGGPPFDFFVTGIGFTEESSIQFNGMSLATEFIPPLTLKLAFQFIPTTPGKFKITVTNPGSWFCEGTSNAIIFEVLDNPPPPPPPPGNNGILTISKMAIGGNGTFRFSVFPTPGIIYIASGASLSLPLAPRSYFIAETIPAGWSLDSVSCNGALYTPITNGISLVVTPGGTPSCMFSNRLATSNDRPRLTVNKILIPGSDPGRFNLRIDGNIAGSGLNVGNGGTTGAYETFVGPHTIGESAVLGTNPADYDYAFGGDCDSTGHVTLANGNNKICTITNTRKPANPPGGQTLTLRKVCIPTDDPGRFVLQIDGASGNQASYTACGGSTDPIPAVAGKTYTLNERGYGTTDISQYDVKISCNGGLQSGGRITLRGGQSVICTFTNKLNGPPTNDMGKLEIIKKASGANAQFIFEVNGSTSLRPTITTSGGEGSTRPMTVKAGTTYAITEKIPNDWKFDDVNCDRPGYIKDSFGLQGLTVVAGQTTTCTFENHQLGFLTIKKNTIGGEGIFNYDIPPYTARIDTAKKDTAGPTPLDPGSSYTITEKNLDNGWQFSSVSCDKSFSADNANMQARNVTIVAGQNTTCTFTNIFDGNEPPTGALHITRISPEEKSACEAVDRLTVEGTGFRTDSKIHFGFLEVATDASNAASGKLTADISQTPEGSHKITVVNPNPDGATSDNFKTLTILGAESGGAEPTISSISPTSANTGAATLTLTVNGTGFTPSSIISFNNYPKSTTFVSETRLTARISPPSRSGTYDVTVTNSSGNSGSCQENASDSEPFRVYGDTDEPSSTNKPQNNVPFTLPPEPN